MKNPQPKLRVLCKACKAFSESKFLRTTAGAIPNTCTGGFLPRLHTRLFEIPLIAERLDDTLFVEDLFQTLQTAFDGLVLLQLELDRHAFFTYLSILSPRRAVKLGDSISFYRSKIKRFYGAVTHEKSLRRNRTPSSRRLRRPDSTTTSAIPFYRTSSIAEHGGTDTRRTAPPSSTTRPSADVALTTKTFAPFARSTTTTCPGSYTAMICSPFP